MTTLPPEPARPPRPRLRRPLRHAAATLAAAARQRQVAESFGADAGRYDRARPGYPAAMVDRIVAESPGRDVVDAGCGTGISARLFQAAGCRVLGVDPDPRMAELARSERAGRGGGEVRAVGRGRADVRRRHRRRRRGTGST